MDKEQERIEKYKNLSEILQNLYGSPESGEAMHKIFLQFQLNEDEYRIYAEIVGDVILGYNKISDIPRLLQQKMGVSADESQRITSKLIDFLSPVVRREEEEAQNKKEELNKLAQTFAKPAAPAQPAPVEEYQGGVEPIRTMEQDMNRVHGYGAYREQQEQQEEKVVSSQDDLLKKD